MGILGGLLAVPDSVYQQMVDTYRGAGVSAEFLPKGNQETVEGTPCIKIVGQDINLVMIRARGMQKGGGFSIGPSISSSKQTTWPKFHFDHLVRGIRGRNPSDLAAELRATTKGLIQKKVVDLKWEGGRLAGVLNSDAGLRDELLRNQVEEVKTETLEKIDCVRIEYTAKVKNIVEIKGVIVKTADTRFENLPPIEIFRICNTIARHTTSV
jgi:hypothetical protein